MTSSLNLHSFLGNSFPSWVPPECDLPVAVSGNCVLRCPRSVCLARCRDPKSWGACLRKGRTPEQLAVVLKNLGCRQFQKGIAEGKLMFWSPCGLQSLLANLSEAEGLCFPGQIWFPFRWFWFVTSDSEKPQQGIFCLFLLAWRRLHRTWGTLTWVTYRAQEHAKEAVELSAALDPLVRWGPHPLPFLPPSEGFVFLLWFHPQNNSVLWALGPRRSDARAPGL